MKTSASTLEFAILGMLSHRPKAGYDLRKAFATNMRYYSDSPGSIYPALRRLEARGLVAAVESPKAESSRGRQVFQLTDEGRTALRAWLEQPVTFNELELSELLLRFAFMDGNVPRSTTLRFLKDFEGLLRARAAEKRQQLEEMKAKAGVHTGVLSFQSWVELIESYARWATSAHAALSESEPVKTAN